MTETGTNREYRDRLFKFIFGNPQNKEWTLSLYNAVNGSHYTDASAIWLNTIQNAVYMSMKNDVSFLVDNTMNFYEQQSTFNPNMPMRFLIYAGMIYSKYVEGSKNYHRYSSVLQKAPTPKCVCFYNGKDDIKDRQILSLSDAFDSDSDVEVKVTMININYGRNKALLDACKPLKEYSWFVDKVRTNQSTMNTLEEAIDAALNELSDDSLIKPFLLANKAEVKRMCITEYDEERTFAEQKEEGRAEGRAEGLAEGKLAVLAEFVKDGLISMAEAAKRAGMNTTEFKSKTGITDN